MVSNPAARLIVGLNGAIVVERRTELSAEDIFRVDVVELGEPGVVTIPADDTVMFEVVGFDV